MAPPAAAEVTAHYARGGLLARLEAALRDDGADPLNPTLEALAPYDQFHGRGLEATAEVAGLMRAAPGSHWLDIGSGIGGPARYFAQRFGCRFTGIDLTPEFCEVARELTHRLGLHDRVDFQFGNALAMPFADMNFDGACSMNVSMNIDDKAALYREIHRVLRPGAGLILSELAAGDGRPLEYPTPWAADAGASFLATLEQTLAGLADAGFEVVHARSTLEQAKAYGARSRALVERGGQPPHRAVMLIHREQATAAMANIARALGDGRIIPVEIVARRPG
jgi:ubiquinone/menaquinone biosynthesis C-methylase UbiE